MHFAPPIGQRSAINASTEVTYLHVHLAHKKKTTNKPPTFSVISCRPPGVGGSRDRTFTMSNFELAHQGDSPEGKLSLPLGFWRQDLRQFLSLARQDLPIMRQNV